MAEKQDIPDPKKTTPNAPVKKEEAWNVPPESLKKPSEKTEKPWDKLEWINKRVQQRYSDYRTDKDRLAASKKNNPEEKWSHDEEDEKKAQEQIALKEEAFKKEEKTYQTITSEITLAKKEKTHPEEQKKIEWEWLTKSIVDLHYDTEPLDDSRVQFLATTFPKAWEKAIVDPNVNLSSQPELAIVRERIQGKLRTTEQDILKNSAWLSKEEVAKKLAENFQKVTGIPTNQETFNKYVSGQVDSLPIGRGWKNTSSESFGPSATRGFSAGWSSEVPSADNGAQDIPPVEASEMTIDTYQWQWSWFKMRWRLKDLPEGSKLPPDRLAKLAKQGTNPGWSTGTCYRSVKNHLCAAGYVKSSYEMTEWSAKNAGSDLKNIDFKNVSSRIWDAQVGDVLVYAWWKNEHGHIEIKTGDGYASDFFSRNPSGRQLIWVWRPPVWGSSWPQNTAWTDKNSQMA